MTYVIVPILTEPDGHEIPLWAHREVYSDFDDARHAAPSKREFWASVHPDSNVEQRIYRLALPLEP